MTTAIKPTQKRYYNVKLGLASKGKLMTLEEIQSMNIQEDQDAYISIYAYNEEQKRRIEETGSVSGIRDVTTDILVWDFDDAKNPDQARQDTVELATRLVDKYGVDPDQIQCYYSGSKGMHVVLPIGKEITPEQFKKVTNDLANGLSTFDSVVSDPARVIRMEYTKHPKTGLFKIPLHIAEVAENNIDTIKEMATQQREDNAVIFNNQPVKLPEELYKIPEKKKPILAPVEYDYKNPPKGWKPYKWALAQGHFDSGERHNALMVVAATCRALGYDKTTTYHICKSAIEKQATLSGSDKFDKEELYINIIEKAVFSDTWSGGQYSPQTNPWLKKYCERMGFDTKEQEEDKIIQLIDIKSQFEHFVDHIEENTILTGIPELDEMVPLTVGMNLGILAPPSAGKTAMAMKILKNTSRAGVISVLASLDMHRNRLFEKILYTESGLSRKELYQLIKERKAEHIFKKVEEEYKNVYFYDRSSPTVADIRNYMLNIEEKTGKKVKLVVIDYFERITADKSDETAASKEIAGKLQDFLNDTNICLITLVQPNKFSMSGGPDTPITSYGAIKGSSFLAQSFRSIIGIWRPFFNPEHAHNDRFLQMSILKNDLGEIGQLNFGWDGKRGEIWGLTEEGEEELEMLLNEKNGKKTDTSDGWN